MNDQIIEALLEAARKQGAVYPSIGTASDRSAVIVDTDSGKVWRVKLEEI